MIPEEQNFYDYFPNLGPVIHEHRVVQLHSSSFGEVWACSNNSACMLTENDMCMSCPTAQAHLPAAIAQNGINAARCLIFEALSHVSCSARMGSRS